MEKAAAAADKKFPGIFMLVDWVESYSLISSP
jgi:hypothetical protein